MHSIIRLCILAAAVFVQAAPSKANLFGEGGDPTPSDPPPDGEVVEKMCGGCEGKKPADVLIPNRNAINGPFKLNSADTLLLIKNGKCGPVDETTDPDTCKKPRDGCTLNAAYYIHPAWPHNGDNVTWEVLKNGTTIKGPHDLKKYTVVLPGPNDPAGPYKWDCGTTTEIVVKWKKNGLTCHVLSSWSVLVVIRQRTKIKNILFVCVSQEQLILIHNVSIAYLYDQMSVFLQRRSITLS